MRHYSKFLFIALFAAVLGCGEEESDSDNIMFSLDPTIYSVHESGNAKFKVYLEREPTAPVNIQVTVSDPGECVVKPPSAQYNPVTKIIPEFIIEGIDDYTKDGDQVVSLRFALTSQDPYFNTKNPIKHQTTVIDDGCDRIGCDVIVNSYIFLPPTDEDGLKVFNNVVMKKPPKKPIMIILKSSDTSEGTVTPSTMIFNAQNYDKPQEYVIQGVDDSEVDGNVPYSVIFSQKYLDSDEAPVEINRLEMVNKDNDQPGANPYAIVAPAELVTDEKGKGIKGSIALTKAPSGDVTVTLTSSDTTEGTAAPAAMTFNAQNYAVPQTFTITGADDNEMDGDVEYTVSAAAKSADPAFNTGELFSYKITNQDDETNSQPAIKGTKIRFMAANITAGKGQSYDSGEGIRIMQAFKPDIIMIQEFNYKTNTAEELREMVDTAFGKEFYYTPGTGDIPNGVISRYPITDSGTWKSNGASNRSWEWAIIDIPGGRDLLAVSVHLSTKHHNSEFPGLMNNIRAKQAENNYHVVLGGDFNTKFGSDDIRSLYSTVGSFFHVGAAGTGSDRCIGGELPVDQNLNRCTSGERDDPYDWVLFDKDMDAYEIPIIIGEHVYQNGHVIDSRIYEQHGELDLIPPVKAADSYLCHGDPFCEHSTQDQKTNMQHQAVIRDIDFPAK